MKELYRIASIILLVLLLVLSACGQKQDEPQEVNNQSGYDSLKAKAFGADDYGMKKYVIAFLKRGPNRPTDSAKSAELQKAHLQNINRMAEEGKLVLAGPFLGNDELRGIYIFNVPSIEEARELTETDPAIQYGSLEMELKEWYGSAALVGLNEAHKSIMKKSVAGE